MNYPLFAKYFLGILFTCSLTLVAHADSEDIKQKNSKVDKMDQMLIEFDLVDENFKYTDPEAVDVIFQIITKRMAKDLKYEKQKGDLKNMGMEMGAYFMNMTLQDISLSDRGEIELRKLKMKEAHAIEGFCRKIYTPKFFKANNYVVDIEYRDARGDTVGHFILNNEVCD